MNEIKDMSTIPHLETEKGEQPTNIEKPNIENPVTPDSSRFIEDATTQREIASVRQQIEETDSKIVDLGEEYVSVETETIKLSIDKAMVRKILLQYGGLSEEEADQVKIEMVVEDEVDGLFKRKNLRWSTPYTRQFGRFLPHYRLREIFTRTQTLEGATIKIFVNNVEALVNESNILEFTKDLGHHLIHVAQRIKHRRGNKVLSALKRGLWHWPKHQFSRLPILHRLSPAEKEARNPINTEEFIDTYRQMVSINRK